MSLAQAGYFPRTAVVPDVEWDARDFNTLADHAANVALDMKSDWQYGHQDSIERARTSGTNLRLCFDGAKRQEGNSSAGMALIAYYSDGSRDLLYRGGRLLGTLESSFTAEALALEWSLDVFLSIFVQS